MNKRIASLFLAIVMIATLGIGSMAATTQQTLVSGNTTGLSAANFVDLADATRADGHHWAWDSIDHVVKAGLFNGTSPTTFAPQNPMTRAQFVVVITRLENTTRSANNKLNVERVRTQTRFTDVPEDMWCAGAVAWAEANGIVQGYTDNTFRPNQAISRAQIAAFVYRYVNDFKKYTLKTLSPEPEQFTDFALASTVFHDAINYCRVHDLIRGFGDHTLRPNISVTRAQVAAILSRIILIIDESTSSGGGGGGGGGGGTTGTTTVKFSGDKTAAQWAKAAYGVKFLAVDAGGNQVETASAELWNKKSEKTLKDENGKVVKGDDGKNVKVHDALEMASGTYATISKNDYGFELTVLPDEGAEIDYIEVYTNDYPDDPNDKPVDKINAPDDYTETKDDDDAVNGVDMTKAQFAVKGDDKKVIGHYTVVAVMKEAEAVSSLTLTVKDSNTEDDYLGGTVEILYVDGGEKSVKKFTDTDSPVTDEVVTAPTENADVDYIIRITPDNANSYELESCDVTNNVTGKNFVEYDAKTPAPAELTFTLPKGTAAHVDVEFKQYEGYLLKVNGIIEENSYTGFFTVPKRQADDSLLASLSLLNNDITPDQSAKNNDAATKFLTNVLDALGDPEDPSSETVSIEVQGKTLDRVLQDAIKDTLDKKQDTMIEQVTSKTESANPGDGWKTKVEDQITETYKQKAGSAASNWKARIVDGEEKYVSFVPLDYSNLTSQVVTAINNLLSDNKFTIEAKTEVEIANRGQSNESRTYYVVGNIDFDEDKADVLKDDKGNDRKDENGDPLYGIVLPEISGTVAVEMQYKGSPTGDGPKYELYDTTTKEVVADMTNPVTGEVVKASGSVDMKALNDYAKEHPISVKFTPDPIVKADIPSTAVEVKNFLTFDTFNNRFEKIITKLNNAGQTDAADAVKKIYNPDDPDDTNAYVQVATVTDGTGEDAKEIVDEITLGGDTMLKVGTAPGSASGKKDAIVIYPRTPDWMGNPVEDTERTTEAFTTNAADSADYGNLEDTTDGKYYDELYRLANNVRVKLSEDYVEDVLTKRASQYTITVDGGSAEDEDLREALAKVISDKGENGPKVADLFRYLGTKANGLTTITVKANKTFSTSGQAGKTLNDVFKNNEVSGEFVIKRFEKMADAEA